MSEKRTVLRAAGIVGFFTLVSRFTGLIRDSILGALFGANRISDIFNIVFELPNLTRRVLGEGALSAFLVPLFAERRQQQGEAASWVFLNRVLNLMLLVALLITVVGMLFAREAFLLFGGLGMLFGRHRVENLNDYLEFGALLTRIMFPFVVGLTGASILMGACHAVRSFVAPSLGSVMLNIAMIGVGLVALLQGVAADSAAVWLGWAVLAGAAGRVLLMIPPLRRHGWRWSPTFDIRDRELLKLLRMMSVAVLGMSISQLNIIVSGFFAMYLGAGVKTYLTYSNRLIQFPMALTATAVATAMLPQLTSYLLEGRREELREMMAFTKRLEALLMVPAMLGLMILGLPILRLVFERANWSAENSLGAYWALLFYAPGLLPLGWVRLLAPLCYARKDLVTPLKAAALGMAANIILNAIFAFLTPLEQSGLALANTLAAFVNYWVLQWYLRRQLGELLGPRPRVGEALTKAMLAGAIACGLGAGLYWGLALAVGPPPNNLIRALELLPIITLVAVIYFGLLHLLRAPDADRASDFLLHRLRRRGAA